MRTRLACLPEEYSWGDSPPEEMKVFVILSEAKDLQLLDFTGCNKLQILRFAQDDMTGGLSHRLFSPALPSAGERSP